MYVQPPRRNNNYIPKSINHTETPYTEINLDSGNSDDDPKASAAVSSTNNAYDVEKDHDFRTTTWWILPEDDEGCNYFLIT